MTTKELSELLNGRERGGEIYPKEEKSAKDSGLVVVYGYSDDNVELRGAIDDEVGAYEGGSICLTKTGLFEEPDCSCTEACPFYSSALKATKVIKAVWHDEGVPCWTFEADIPHETFNIYEDGELFCVGIVFSMEDLAK